MVDAKSRDTRLDFARATAIFLVLIWHLQPIQRAISGSSFLTKFLNKGLEILYMQISLVAVPLFLLVSLYLYFQKLEGCPLEQMRKRLLRLGKIYLFWTICQFAVYYTVNSRLQDGLINVTVPFSIGYLVSHGGPPLPIVRGSVFYFLLILFILVMVSTGYYYLSKFRKSFPIIGISIVIISLLYFEYLVISNGKLPYWRIENYIIYIPLAYFLSKQDGLVKFRYLPYFSYSVFILFSIHDINLRNQGHQFQTYARVSIVFGALAFFSFILSLKPIKLGTISTFLSKYSLGVYATHKYWQLFVILMLNYFGFSIPAFAAGFPLGLRALVEAVIASGLTFLAIFFAARTPLKRFIC